MNFHEVLFPLDVALHARGGPERRTDVVLTGSGREERNQRWSRSRRRWDAGYGVKSLSAIASVVEFFEERRGRLYGFRWRDRVDCKSCAPNLAPTPLDQALGTGDGAVREFQLVKRYGASFAPYSREVVKPVAGSVRVAVAGVEAASSRYALDASTGRILFAATHTPPPGAAVTAGFVFDAPVRFDTDYLEIDLAAFEAGDIPKIPLVEIIP
ncbi:MAG: hypothetical protein JWN93_250 [Hyphomicrobiales bacterium]|nr:hypothetical protein [Hyphomicrobiales bacterium]